MGMGIKPTVDFAFKITFGSPENKRALIGLLNAVLNRPCPIVDIEILNPFSYQEFEDDKLSVLDVRARDSTGCYFDIEMQVAVLGNLIKRMVYYASNLFSSQLTSGHDYGSLRGAISICLLNQVLFKETATAHHHFRLHDVASGKTLDDTIELHTVELVKYDLDAATISRASKLEQWVFFLLYADQYTAAELRALLPGVEFDQAITAIERISQKTKDRAMYDQREKAQRDQQWMLNESRKEGRQEGHVEGLEEGIEKGIEKGAVIGSITTLQAIIGDTVTAADELKALDLDTLNRLYTELQERLRSRGN